MIKNILRALKNYINRFKFVAFKMRHHLKYSLSLSNLRSSEFKLREIAHSIDKAQKLATYDKKRVAARIQTMNSILSKTPNLSKENQTFFQQLGLIRNDNFSAVHLSIGLPSIRHFSKESIDTTAIKNSINEAAHYPISCSRQSISLIQFSGVKQDAAGCFSGFTAFEVDNYELFIVVADLTAFDQRSEIFAPYIDGTIFATAFCDALWRREIGSCMLNWSSQSISQEKNLRKLARLSETDLIVMGIVVGHPTYIPFHATRKHSNQFLKVI
tara:strand:+ start:335 stop:1147 length:813 start_codon:yes stop_codon:yes gene_type:complete